MKATRAEIERCWVWRPLFLLIRRSDDDKKDGGVSSVRVRRRLLEGRLAVQHGMAA